MELRPGTIVDRFEVVRHLGDGGLARVFLVRHRTLQSLHALKVLRASDADMYRRFVQEGRVQARIRHPHVVAVTDIVELGDRVGLVMEYVDGTSLQAALADGEPLSRADALRLFSQMCEGVLAAHAAGVLHRDLKPANVLLALRGDQAEAKIADFGIAKVARRDGPALTEAGQTMGTPGYMAPEQILDAATVDARADVFSLGAILYEILSGFPVFRKKDVGQSLAATLNGQHQRLRERAPSLPASIEAVIERSLSMDPARRQGSVRALYDEVRACADEILAAPRGAPTPQAAPTPTILPAGTRAPTPSAPTLAPPREPATAADPAWDTTASVAPTRLDRRRQRASSPTWTEDAAQARVTADRGELAPRTESRRARSGAPDPILRRRSRLATAMPALLAVFVLVGSSAGAWFLATSAAEEMGAARAKVVSTQAAHDAAWPVHMAVLDGVIAASRDRAALGQTLDTWRFASSPPERVEAGVAMVRALRLEAARQGEGAVAAPVEAALQDLDARLQAYGAAIDADRSRQAGLGADLARAFGLVSAEGVDQLRTSTLDRTGPPPAP